MSQYPPSGSPGGFSPNPYAPSASTGTPMPPGSVKNWLVESILVLVCCCWPLAIPGIVYAAQVNGKLAQGDYAGAVKASNSAKMWVIIAMCAGLLVNGLVAALQIIAIAANQ